MRARHLLTLALGLGLLGGCRPEYPSCNDDDDCREGELCVDGTCQQCREDADCEAGETCNDGRCDPIAGYCDEQTPCPDGQECVGNRCRTVDPCRDVSCPAGQECRGGDCEAIPGYCDDTMPCPEGQECIGNRCVTPEACTLDAVYFAFDSSDIETQARNVLQSNAQCITEREIERVHLTGHTDPRGTEEYNLALGDRRSRAAKRYMQQLGVRSTITSSSAGEEMARGTSEGSWDRDRRVEFTER
ncbi:MAG: OmpA family protein [Myxococcota bacterium]